MHNVKENVFYTDFLVLIKIKKNTFKNKSTSSDVRSGWMKKEKKKKQRKMLSKKKPRNKNKASNLLSFKEKEEH